MRRVLIALLVSPLAAQPLAAQPLAVQQAAAPAAADAPVLTLTADATLDPAVTYGGLVLAADGITVDGHGARILGSVLRAAPAGAAPAPDSFTGIGVRAAGVSGITLRNLRVTGFEIGLLIEDGVGWRISDCDFSDNFHDPDFGWGEQGEKGGLVLRRVHGSELQRVRANRCWNGASLVDCEDDGLLDCDFSHSSNVCLKLWHSSRNSVTGCDLSWGLRISPGEVHARDSACVLIESGSDGNSFEANDCTHGGDGIFIRVLNNWTSTGNVFHANDVSWANNNGFEAWSPGNSYLFNRANHCSYGFWLGASDKTLLRDNEAGWNGDPDGFHNAPESFGHGGIVFVNGPSHHTTVERNRLHHNAGGGLVLRGDEASGGAAWKAFHWVIQDNVFEANRWGVWMRHADSIELGPNSYRDNREGDVFDAGGVTNLRRWGQDGRTAPHLQSELPAKLRADPPGPWRVGQVVTLDSFASPRRGAPTAVTTRWSFGDGTVAEAESVRKSFERPGFYRIAATLHDRSPSVESSSLAWIDGYVVADDELPATQERATAWAVDETGASRASFADEPGLLGTALHAHIEPYDGHRASLLWPATRDAALPLAGRTTLDFWIRTRNPNIPAWQDNNPVVTLWQDTDRWLRLTPTRDLLGNPPDVHFRDEWMPVGVPLAGGAGWTRETGPAGEPETAQWLTIGVDSWGAPPLDVWLDGLALR